MVTVLVEMVGFRRGFSFGIAEGFGGIVLLVVVFDVGIDADR